MSIKAHTVQKITYKKSAADISERYIVPVSVPGNIKALDVSDLDEEKRSEVGEYCKEYNEYLKQHMKQAFSFEDWLAHTQNVDFRAKWRTFKPEQTEVSE